MTNRGFVASTITFTGERFCRTSPQQAQLFRIEVRVPNIDDMFEAPPYVEGRHSVTRGKLSRDFSPIQHLKCWRRAFPKGSVDWASGWRNLWSCAADMIGTGTDFCAGMVAMEIEAFFSDGTERSFGTALDCEAEDRGVWGGMALRRDGSWSRWLEDKNIWGARAMELLADACGSDEPFAGCVGIVVEPEDERSRPCLTMVVTGPGGALQAAMIIKQALGDNGITAGVAVRTVRKGTAGVVKVLFLPELYLPLGDSRFGIDWPLWSRLAAQSPAENWASASLIWSDFVIRAAHNVKEAASLIVDQVYFDFMRVVPISSKLSAAALLSSKPSLNSLLTRLWCAEPHSFLFYDTK